MGKSEIYTVTTIDIRDPEAMPYWHTVAVFTNLQDAIQCVKENAVDISENGTNQYAIVEKTYINCVYPAPESNDDKEIYWFEWNPEEEEYVKGEIPFNYQNVYAFGIG